MIIMNLFFLKENCTRDLPVGVMHRPAKSYIQVVMNHFLKYTTPRHRPSKHSNTILPLVTYMTGIYAFVKQCVIVLL